MALARLWVTLAAIALAGCNLAYSPTPMLTAADAGNEPFLKHGLWEWAGRCDEPQKTTECRRDPQRFVITAESWRTAGKDPPGKQDVMPAPPYLAVPGQPLVLQVKPDDTSEKQGELTYVFLGLAPLKRDPDGKITGAEAWLVQCGPPPPKPDKRQGENTVRSIGYVTLEPVPGMKIIGDNCVPQDRTALVNAAARSRDWEPGVFMTMTWLQP